ncbi:hypothetical protein [Providencia phage vB_PreS-PatoteraRojo]|nr:hypothetical protein [Providencia phage vB_PreS-PatoteraRojo]
MNNPVNHQQIKSAMMTMENDVELPSRVRMHSAVGNLIALSVGESFTLSMELPAEKTLGELQQEANALKSKMRNSMNASIRNAKQHCGNTYSMESALITYPSGRAFIQIVVTRTVEDDEDQPNIHDVLEDDDEV